MSSIVSKTSGSNPAGARQNFILVANDGYSDHSDARIPALKVAEERLGRGTWNLYRSTRNRDAIKANDRILIYVAGHGQHRTHIIAKAVVAEVLQPPRNLSMTTEEAPSKVLRLGQIERIGPVSITRLAPTLSFVPKHNKWGVALMGGCRKISDADYETIIKQ